MAEIKNIKIGRIDFSITRNGDISTRIFPEEFTTDITKSVVFYGEGHYLVSRSIGDIVEYTTRNGFNNVIVPDKYNEVFASGKGTGLILNTIYNNFRKSLDNAKNGDLSELSPQETISYISENFAETSFFVNKVFDLVQNSTDGFYKYLLQQMGLKKSTRNFDPELVIQNLGLDLYKNYKKNFRLSGE